MLILWFVAIIATVFDALRDRFYPRIANEWPRWTNEQWLWHGLKWVSFYTPLIYIIWGLNIYEKLLMALICFILWRAAYSGFSKSRKSLVSQQRDIDLFGDDDGPGWF